MNVGRSPLRTKKRKLSRQSSPSSVLDTPTKPGPSRIQQGQNLPRHLSVDNDFDIAATSDSREELPSVSGKPYLLWSCPVQCNTLTQMKMSWTVQYVKDKYGWIQSTVTSTQIVRPRPRPIPKHRTTDDQGNRSGQISSAEPHTAISAKGKQGQLLEIPLSLYS
jgi:hypothetical protein